jgi:hypothetical protein
VWGLVPGIPEDDNNWSAGDVSADGAVLYLATSDGGLSIVDSRSNSSSIGGSVVIANRKVSGLVLPAAYGQHVPGLLYVACIRVPLMHIIYSADD